MSFYRKFLSYEHIIFLKKKKACLESPPRHFLNTKSIFIHIPKAAGMSIVKSLYGIDYSNHDTWLEQKRRSPHFFNRAFKFAFVREPRDRLISSFNYLCHGGKSQIDLYWRDKYLREFSDLDSFIREGGLQKAMNGGAEHFIPQWKFIFNKDLGLEIDFLGHFESLESDYNFVCRTLKINNSLAFVNKTETESKINLSPEAEAIIKEMYQLDYSLLGYNADDKQ